jgi:predicted nucleic acid-binding Zn finger protein
MSDSDIWQRLAEQKCLDPDLRGEIEAIFGTRGKKALAAIDERKIKKFLDFFVVEGKTARYIVDEDFCTCGDFLYRNRTCWHLLAVRIASVTETFEPVNLWYLDEMKNGREQNLD